MSCAESSKARSLFIFSFEYFKQLPKKPSARRWLILVVVCVTLSALVAERVRWNWGQVREPRTFRTAAIEAMKSLQVDVFFIGSSHIYADVDPSAFSMHVVNLAESGLNYQLAEIMLDRYWHHVAFSKAVVLEFDAVPFYKDSVRFRMGDLSDFWDWDLSPEKLPLSHWERILARMDSTIAVRRFPPVHHQLSKVKTNIGPGFQPSDTDLSELSAGEYDSFISSLGTLPSPAMIQANKSALNRIINRLADADIQVILFRPPFHERYTSNTAGRIRETIADNALAELLDISSEIEIIDFRALRNLPDRYFSDWTHLSRTGAAAISRELSIRLSRMIEEKN